MKIAITSIFLFAFFFPVFAHQNPHESEEFIKIIIQSPLEHVSRNKNCDTKICIELLRLIHSSEKTIDFAIYGLRNQDAILSALIVAKERGVIDKDIFNNSYYSDTHLIEEYFVSVVDLKGAKDHYSVLRVKVMRKKIKLHLKGI